EKHKPHSQPTQCELDLCGARALRAGRTQRGRKRCLPPLHSERGVLDLDGRSPADHAARRCSDTARDDRAVDLRAAPGRL
ncbi:MAG: hypothetical protein AVDCRST_MAG42-43, partial [uncultured Chthoniobacterales bacterium]